MNICKVLGRDSGIGEGLWSHTHRQEFTMQEQGQLHEFLNEGQGCMKRTQSVKKRTTDTPQKCVWNGFCTAGKKCIISHRERAPFFHFSLGFIFFICRIFLAITSWGNLYVKQNFKNFWSEKGWINFVSNVSILSLFSDNFYWFCILSALFLLLF